ncbi:hypothetical protein [Pseudonocardia adelaidensis]|uniref:Mutator family transposase n=1 Tax=Pseudonocardia adelaidensis TaxID=648754 RepID=A0ABP9NVF9_9PSEU
MISVRQYQRPNGEVVALLVISPSKSDRERVIPMSGELFHIIAQVIRRHTAEHGTVPVCTLYDQAERAWSEPLPYLFQRLQSGSREPCPSRWSTRYGAPPKRSSRRTRNSPIFGSPRTTSAVRSPPTW